MAYYFSIITVCYNSSFTIERTIQSVFSQAKTFSGEIQYILIDGNSTDNTLEVIRRCGKAIPDNITLKLISESDDGIYDAMNKGIRCSDGLVIGILNSDDEYLPSTLKDVSIAFSEDTKLSIVHADIYWKYSFVGKKDLIVERPGSDDLSQLSKGMSINHPTVFCRREVYSELGLFDLNFRFSADWAWFLSVTKSSLKIRYINRVYATFDMGGVSNRFIPKRYFENLHIYYMLYLENRLTLRMFILLSLKVASEFVVYYFYFLFTSAKFRAFNRYKRASKYLNIN